MRYRERLSTPLSRDVPRGSRRTLVLYLVAIVVPTIVLLVFGLEALRQQRDSVARLAEANRVLAEGAVADALEKRVESQAAECLRDGEIGEVVSGGPWLSPGEIRAARLELARVARRHPIARDLFLIEDGEVRVPKAAPSWPQSLEDLLVGEPGASARRLRAAFALAEQLEGGNRFGEALGRYRAIFAGGHPETLAALALARMARCYEHLGQRDEARDAYAQLATRFRAVYDLAGRPYALDAGVELTRLERVRDGRTAVLLGSLRGDLADGAWEVTPEEADYLMHAVGTTNVRSAGTSYLRYLRSAQVLADSLPSYSGPQDGLLHVMPTTEHDTARQFYHQRRNERRAVALEVDLDRVADILLPELLREMRLAESVVLIPAGRTGTAFRVAFPFWRIHAAPSSDAGLSGPRPALVALATLLVLGVLLLSVALLLRDTARQATTNRLRADLVGGISHDLKTPLSVIKLYAETLSSDPDTDRESRRSYYDVIVQESERLTALIDHVLDFSRVESGTREYQLRPGSLTDVVGQVLERYRPHLDGLGFLVEYRAAPDVPRVRFDEGAVSQAVLNLLDNAVKYSDGDRRIAVRVLRRGERAAIEVEDHGIGIPERDRDRIFARFSRGSRPAARAGHGLGLYLVKHMAEAHGARIELHSSPGRGTLLCLLFPAAAGSERAAR